VLKIGGTWPSASDGWSDIDNYLPPSDLEVERAADAVLDEMVGAVLGRAERCLAFLQLTERAFALVGDVSIGNTEYARLSEIATEIEADARQASV
jgi:hypothetical protein